MMIRQTKARTPRAALVTRRALAEVIGGTNGTIISENGFAAPPIGANAVVGGGHS